MGARRPAAEAARDLPENIEVRVCDGLTGRDETRLPQDLWQRREEDSLTGLFLREMEQLCAKRPDDPVCRLAARFGLAALENGEDICP